MIRSTLLVSAAMILIPAAAHAQQGQTAPTRITPPSRADQVAPSAPRPQAAIKRGPKAAAPKVSPFVLHSVTITGSTLPAGALAAAYQPFIGQTLNSQGIQNLSDAIAAVYDTADIAIYSVLIPDQDVRSGDLAVKVLEGRAEEVRFEHGRAGRARRLIEKRAARLTAQAPLAKSSLQREISLIRDIPGLNTGMELLNGSTDDGVVIKIDPEFHPVQVGFAINNRGTYLLGRTQVQGDLYLNSMLRSGDQTRLTYAAPTSGDLFKFGALSHSTPLGSRGNVLLLSGSYLETNPAGTALEGHASSLGVQFTRPVLRSFDRDLYVTIGLDGVNSDNALVGTTFSDDRSRAGRLAIAYGRTLPRSNVAVVVSVSQGIDGLGARTFTPAFTDLDFFKANLRANYSHTLGEHAAIRLKGAGQLTTDRLPGSEQFSLGGMDYGRAYETAIISGDRGYAGSVELAYRPTAFKAALSGSEVYGFFDGGKTRYLARGVLPTSSLDLASFGAGVRLSLKGRAVLEVEGARGTRNSIAALDQRDWRGVVSLRTLF